MILVCGCRFIRWEYALQKGDGLWRAYHGQKRRIYSPCRRNTLVEPRSRIHSSLFDTLFTPWLYDFFTHDSTTTTRIRL
jgi:hypothetical protein